MTPSENLNLTLEHRLASLERRFHRMRTLAYVLAVVAILPYLTAAQKQAKTAAVPLRTEQIDFVRGDSVVGSIAAAPARTKAQGLVFLNPSGKINGGIVFDEDGGNFHLYSNAESSLALLYVDQDGGGLGIKNRGGKYVAAIYARHDTAGGEMDIYNRNGNSIAAMYARRDGAGGEVDVNDRSARRLGSLFVLPDSNGADIQVLNRSGKIVGEMYARSDSGGELDILSKTQQRIGTMFARPDGAGGDFQIGNGSGSVVGELFARSDGAGGDFQVSNGTKVVGELYAQPSRGGALNVYESGGTEVGTLFARQDGAGADLQIFTSASNRVVALFSSGEREGRLQLYDQAGKLLHSVP